MCCHAASCVPQKALDVYQTLEGRVETIAVPATLVRWYVLNKTYTYIKAFGVLYFIKYISGNNTRLI